MSAASLGNANPLPPPPPAAAGSIGNPFPSPPFRPSHELIAIAAIGLLVLGLIAYDRSPKTPPPFVLPAMPSLPVAPVPPPPVPEPCKGNRCPHRQPFRAVCPSCGVGIVVQAPNTGELPKAKVK